MHINHVSSSVFLHSRHAFGGCTGLSNIVIGNSVSEIGEDAFKGCTGLTSIVVSKGNKVYDSRDNCNAIIETKTNKLMVGCKNTVIPESVTEIGNGAFNGCRSLKSIVIPNSVKKIGDSAFAGCISLKSVDIPDSVIWVGNDVFEFCGNLQSVYVPASWNNFDNLGCPPEIIHQKRNAKFDKLMGIVDALRLHAYKESLPI